jgi:GMP synthase PP-ATPase subunit
MAKKKTEKKMSGKEIIRIANEIARPFNLKAEIFPDIYSVGVQGDEGTYSPVVNLVGPFPGNKALEKISNEITSRLPVNRVTIQIAKKS